MFESIHFVDMPKRTYSSKEIVSEKNEYNGSVFPKLNATQLQTLIAPAVSGEFCLTGDVRVMSPIYMPRNLPDHYMTVDSFTWAKSESGTYMMRSGVENYMLCYTYDGEADLYYDDRYFHLKANDGFWIDCRKYHYYKVSNNHWNHMELYISGNDVRDYYKAFVLNHSVVFHSDCEYMSRLERVLNHYQNIRVERDLLVHSSLTDLLGWLLENHDDIRGGMKEVIRDVIQYIHMHSNEKISMDKLAEVGNISKYHLSREFKVYTGLSPIEYVIETRLENAKFLLRNSELPIDIIAQYSGIGTVQYMARLFRQKYDTTPNQYRKGGSVG